MLDYIEKNWIDSSFWPPSSWWVFGLAVRTNNDEEGWHQGLHSCAHGQSQLPFYVLVERLQREAELVNLTAQLVSDQKVPRVRYYSRTVWNIVIRNKFQVGTK